MAFFSVHPILGSLAVLASGLIVTFVTKLYHARVRIIKLQRQGLAMPPHNLFFGHLLVVNAVMSKLPADARSNYIPRQIRAAMPGLGPIFYLDLWPFGPQTLVVSTPAGIYQMTQEHSLPKFHAMRKFLRPMTGEYDLVTMEGDMWKMWRNIFSPGFSSGHLIGFASAIVKDTITFCGILRECDQARGLVSLKKLTDNLTMDVIGKVVLDTDLNTQRSKNVLASALRRQIPWLSFGAEFNPFDRYNPLRPLIQWYNAREMNNYIYHELEDRFQSHKNSKELDVPRHGRSIVDLALKSSLAGRASNSTDETDPSFKSFIASQVKMFIFAGHDTTSSTLCYMYHLLSCHPPARDRVCAEHNSIIGSDLKEMAAIISENPHLLNQLPFTVAVIKETLRLFPPSSTTRGGEPGFFIKDADGNQYPTDGFMVWSNHETTHRDPFYWPQPASFLPDRWLVSPGNPLYPMKGAWRPFEYGPRNCIGQELTMIEMKIVMVMTLRQFDIKPAYQEWDHQKGKAGILTVEGERAYQVGIGAPSEGLPCQVRRREN